MTHSCELTSFWEVPGSPGVYSQVTWHQSVSETDVATQGGDIAFLQFASTITTTTPRHTGAVLGQVPSLRGTSTRPSMCQ